MKRKAGFSLVEFVIVLAIITLLLTILLPAFVRGREAARRISCFNNLKQQIMAMQSYQASHGVLPSGCVDAGGPLADVDGEDRMSWITSLLPFSEQRALYDTINFSLGVSDAANQTARMSSMSMLLCPSSGVWAYRTAPFSWTVATPPGMEGLTSYAGSHHDVEALIDVNNNGVFYRNSRTRPIDVTDGLSQTLYIGEVAYPSMLGWLSGSRATMRNTGHPINGVAAEAFGGVELPKALVAGGMKAEDLERMIASDQVAVPPGFVGGFGSRHGDGSIFAFGDGSARFLKESIDPAVLRLLGNRSDGEAIDDSSY